MNKASGGDGIPVELFQILKDGKCCTQYASKFGKLSSDHRIEKFSFYSNPKERQCQRMLKLLHNCTHLTHQQNNAQNSPSQVSAIRELLNSRCSSWIRKGRGTRDVIANIHWVMGKAREFQKNIYFCLIDYAKAFDCVDHNKRWKILKKMGISDRLTCLLRNLYAGQEATVRTGHGTTDWFQIGKGVL